MNSWRKDPTQSSMPQAQLFAECTSDKEILAKSYHYCSKSGQVGFQSIHFGIYFSLRVIWTNLFFFSCLANEKSNFLSGRSIG